MTASAFSQLRAALVAHLLGAGLAEGRVFADRLRPIAAQEPSAINVRLSDTQRTTPVIEAADWRSTFFVECLARSVPGGASADAAADALLDGAYTRLQSFAASVSGLGLAVIDIEGDATSVEWDRVAEDQPYVCAALRLTVVHRTPANSLQPWAS